MKKVILLMIVLCSTTIFAQKNSKTRFSKFSSITELKKEFPKVKESEKFGFFTQYLRLTELQELKNDAKFKKFPVKVLSQLTYEMYQDYGCDDCSDNVEYKNAIKFAESKIKANKKVKIEDLEKIYNPTGIYSGLQITDLSTKGNQIFLETSNGLKTGTYHHTYKVVGNKLIEK